MSRRLVAAITTIRSRAAEAVQLHQELVEGALALRVGAGGALPAGAPDGVDLVEEDDGAGLALAGLGEQVPHPRGAHADVGVHEVGARQREEGHAGLARHGLRQKGLPGTRRAVQDRAVRHPGAHLAEALGLAQEHHDLLELLHGLVAAGHVGEAHGRRHHDLGALADGAVTRGAATAPDAPALGVAAPDEHHPAEQERGDQGDAERYRQEPHDAARGGGRGRGRRGEDRHAVVAQRGGEVEGPGQGAAWWRASGSRERRRCRSPGRPGDGGSGRR